MAQILVRELPDDVKERLRVRAAQRGRPLETEVRQILIEAVAPARRQKSLVDALVDAAAAVGGVDLELPARTETQRPVTFE
ncbi:plasmid stabilization protein [Jiangella ureilytica]|uniref:Plasmid stabilization protein n=1 Tax=Jiangella ureilytica TaxID=2530374 RepID=A0A4V6PB56_9ACTN|nr:plasmid stabilization protein [Jiangella ureilytica]TDC52605.1 plasmid stabilization protein [Jiangella ureilytica]